MCSLLQLRAELLKGTVRFLVFFLKGNGKFAFHSIRDNVCHCLSILARYMEKANGVLLFCLSSLVSPQNFLCFPPDFPTQAWAFSTSHEAQSFSESLGSSCCSCTDPLVPAVQLGHLSQQPWADFTTTRKNCHTLQVISFHSALLYL